MVDIYIGDIYRVYISRIDTWKYFPPQLEAPLCRDPRAAFSTSKSNRIAYLLMGTSQPAN